MVSGHVRRCRVSLMCFVWILNCLCVDTRGRRGFYEANMGFAGS